MVPELPWTTLHFCVCIVWSHLESLAGSRQASRCPTQWASGRCPPAPPPGTWRCWRPEDSAPVATNVTTNNTFVNSHVITHNPEHRVKLLVVGVSQSPAVVVPAHYSSDNTELTFDVFFLSTCWDMSLPQAGLWSQDPTRSASGWRNLLGLRGAIGKEKLITSSLTPWCLYIY